MCYSLELASRERQLATETGAAYRDSFAKLAGEWSTARWSTVFARPYAPILTGTGDVLMAQWTFLNPDVRDEQEADRLPNRTGNCVAEKMFKTWPWTEAAVERRGLLAVENYYEYQHRIGPRGGDVPVAYRFFRPSGDVYYLGVLWTYDWLCRPCFAVCTMAPNEIASWVHNGNETRNGPRQPVIPRTLGEQLAWMEGGGPATVDQVLTVRDDVYLVAQLTANSAGRYPKRIPPEPVGKPADGILDAA